MSVNVYWETLAGSDHTDTSYPDELNLISVQNMLLLILIFVSELCPSAEFANAGT